MQQEYRFPKTRQQGKSVSFAEKQFSEGMDELKTKIQQLEEQLKDDDQDGVPNGIDNEPATVAGSLVDSRGVGLKDADNDGIADAYDYCPDQAGPFSTNGCADADKDGLRTKTTNARKRQE